MGFEPTPLAWKARILASILMVHFKLITRREMRTPFWSSCSILPIPDNYLSRYQFIVDSESSLLLLSQDKTFYKSVISASTYYTVKLIHIVLRSIDLICQPNFSVRLWTLLNFTSATSLSNRERIILNIYISQLNLSSLQLVRIIMTTQL